MSDNVFIVNYDAALINGETYVTIVAKDPLGRRVAIQILKKSIDDPEAVEAYAILKAVQMAIERGWTNLWCFSDAKVVIQCLINANPLKAHW